MAGDAQLADVVGVMKDASSNSAVRGKERVDDGIRFMLDHAGNPDIAAFTEATLNNDNAPANAEDNDKAIENVEAKQSRE